MSNETTWSTRLSFKSAMTGSCGFDKEKARDFSSTEKGETLEGTVMGMILLIVCHKYDYKIREHGKRLQMQSNGFYYSIAVFAGSSYTVKTSPEGNGSDLTA
nr:reticulon-like protein B13 [Tanacetum cinerariifolium]